VITSIALTRKPLDFDKVKAVYAARLAQFERFRCRVVEPALPLGTPHWERCRASRSSSSCITSPCRAWRQGRARRAGERPGEHASGPRRPLWDVHVVDGVDGGSALITRMHHCIGDGTASVLVARALFDTSPKAWRDPAATAAPRRRPRA